MLPQPTRTPPMPEIQPALVHVPDAINALERAKVSWNRGQLEDALRSARYFIDKAENSLAVQTCKRHP